MDLKTDPPLLVIEFADIEKGPFLQALEEGFSSEVIYRIRLRKQVGQGPFTVSAGRNTTTITKSAGKEYLTGMYIITTANRQLAYQEASDFTNAFFSCRTAVPNEYLESGDYFIEVKAVADLIKRPRPLSLLDPFLLSEKTDTPWVRFGD